MKFTKETAELFVPDGSNEQTALSRTTHLGICAHQDDLELSCLHGINLCYDSASDYFSGVVCTDGAGSARTGEFQNYSDSHMARVRRQEQREAAELGRYSAVIQLDYYSAEAKGSRYTDLIQDIKVILEQTLPTVVYTHNLADKHPTHLAVVLATIAAIRLIPNRNKPQKLYGVEGWRGLDWLDDSHKVGLDVSKYPDLADQLIGVHRSQIAGGKRYDLAATGRRKANATFFNSHAVDASSMINFAMDLSVLINNSELDPVDYIIKYIDLFRADVSSKLRQIGRP